MYSLLLFDPSSGERERERERTGPARCLDDLSGLHAVDADPKKAPPPPLLGERERGREREREREGGREGGTDPKKAPPPPLHGPTLIDGR